MSSHRTAVAVVICLAGLAGFAVRGLTQGDERQKAAEQEIRGILDQTRVAAIKGDVAYFQAYLADDLSRIEARGGMASKEDAIHSIRAGDVKYESLESRDLKIRLYGEFAIATLIYDFKATNRGKDVSGSNRTTRVLAKRNGRWQEVAFQATRIQQQ